MVCARMVYDNPPICSAVTSIFASFFSFFYFHFSFPCCHVGLYRPKRVRIVKGVFWRYYCFLSVGLSVLTSYAEKKLFRDCVLLSLLSGFNNLSSLPFYLIFLLFVICIYHGGTLKFLLSGLQLSGFLCLRALVITSNVPGSIMRDFFISWLLSSIFCFFFFFQTAFLLGFFSLLLIFVPSTLLWRYNVSSSDMESFLSSIMHHFFSQLLCKIYSPCHNDPCWTLISLLSLGTLLLVFFPSAFLSWS